MADWLKPEGYMNVGKIGDVVLMTPKASAGLKPRIIRTTAPPTVWAILYRKAP